MKAKVNTAKSDTLYKSLENALDSFRTRVTTAVSKAQAELAGGMFDDWLRNNPKEKEVPASVRFYADAIVSHALRGVLRQTEDDIYDHVMTMSKVMVQNLNPGLKTNLYPGEKKSGKGKKA